MQQYTIHPLVVGINETDQGVMGGFQKCLVINDLNLLNHLNELNVPNELNDPNDLNHHNHTKRKYLNYGN